MSVFTESPPICFAFQSLSIASDDILFERNSVAERAPENSLQLRSKVTSDGKLELSLQRTAIGEPKPDELIVRVDAAPVNPSDLGMLLGPADLTLAKTEGDGENRVTSIPLSPAQAKALWRRKDLSLCPGLEGAGTVIAAGAHCKDHIGKTVAMFGGTMYAEHRKISIDDCMVFPEGVEPAKCASSFVNPLTALSMLDVFHREGHKAVVHTAAASNLGQMLVKLCNEDGIPLINIVRRENQEGILRALDAQYICNSESPTFLNDLVQLFRETQATLAFDAIGGGAMASTILQAMETVYAPEEFYIYGSNVHKQVYVYGILNPAPIEISRTAGMAWSVSGFLMMNYLDRLDAQTVQKMKDRIVRGYDTAFKSHYTNRIALTDMLDVSILDACNRRSTGQKYLLAPHKGTQ